MADLDFTCTGVRPEAYAAAPTLLFGLRITEAAGARVHALLLRCQLRIEPARRRYAPREAERLGDLFGTPERWGTTLKPLQFAHTSVAVPGFTGETEIDLPVPCSYDLDVACSKYFHALTEGEVPLLILFSGTAFTADPGFRAEPVPWHKEASCRMPVKVWEQLMEQHFPRSGWLRVSHDSIGELQRFRSARALTSWEQTFHELLRAAEPERHEPVRYEHYGQPAHPARGER